MALPPVLPPTTMTTTRPAPSRRGQPASQRDFERSSAGGAASHLGVGEALQSSNGRDGSGGAGLSQVQQRKQQRWGDTYVSSPYSNAAIHEKGLTDPHVRAQVADEETLRNDYAGQYVQTGARPQNYLRNTAVETRFAE